MRLQRERRRALHNFAPPPSVLLNYSHRAAGAAPPNGKSQLTNSTTSKYRIMDNLQNQQKNEIVVYQPDETIRLDVRLENETVWLTQSQMSELFQRDRSVITRHINNVFAEGELYEERNVQNLHIPFSDKHVKAYSLNVVISVGYRVKFPADYVFELTPDEVNDLRSKILTANVSPKSRQNQAHRPPHSKSRTERSQRIVPPFCTSALLFAKLFSLRGECRAT